MKSDVDRQITKMMNAVVRRKILDCIQEVVRHFNGEKSEGIDNCYEEIKGMHRVAIAGAATDLKYESCGIDCEGLSFKVLYGGQLMFEARTSNHRKTFASDDARCVRKYGTQWMSVSRFLPGIWMKALDLKSLIKAQEATEKKARARIPPPEAFRERDDVVARRFGIKLPA